MSDLLQFVAKKDYSSFRKEYNQVFEQKFDELASEIEKDAIAELSLYPTVEAKKYFKIYGNDGHRQRESFNDSTSFTTRNGMKIEVYNSDKTGTNEYSILAIDDSKNKNKDVNIENELQAQLDDGVFENSRFGKIVEISKNEFDKILKSKKSVSESKRTMKKVKENEDEFELVSIEAPEDEKSIIIKYELDGEKGEKILDEEDDIEYYKEIVSDTDDLTDEQMNKIKSDCLESKKRK